MSVNIEYRPEHKVIIATSQEPYAPAEETIQIMGELQKRLTENKGNIHFVSDLRSVKISFSDLVEGMALAFRTPGSAFADPRVKVYVVGNQEFVDIGAKAATEQSQYGRVPIQVFNSVEGALEAVRKAQS
jgi:hypothetical protein